jgi:DNA-binding NtrC family response regulator
MSETLNVGDPRPSLRALLDAYERRLIESALAATRGNQRQAAFTLGLLPTTLHEKMKRLGLRPRTLRRRRADGEGAGAPS